MKHAIFQITLVVRDYDEAIDFYTRVLGFELKEDTPLSNTKRWVVVKPPGEGGCALLLAKASGEWQEQHIGNQTGGRVFLFMHTDDFMRDYHHLTRLGVKFIRGPVNEPYGTVGVFEDLYGNLWDLIEPSPGSGS